MNNFIKANAANFVSAIVLLLSWLAIIFLLKDLFYLSFGLILLAFVFDAIDGYLARTLGIDNKLGRAIDGYIDVVNYLVYPALVFWVFFDLTTIFAIFSIFIFLAAGIFRLARFEVEGIKKKSNKMYYEGLPVFFNPVLILVLLLLSKYLEKATFFILAPIILLLESYLMVLTFKFPKPKNVIPVIVIVLIVSFGFILAQFVS